MTEALLDPSFPQVVVDEMRRRGNTNDDAARFSANWFIRNRQGIPGAPEVSQVELDDADAIFNASLFNVDQHTDWSTFKASLVAAAAAEAATFNPYLPLWMSKTEDKPTPWLTSVGQVPDVVRRRLNEAVSGCCPMSSDSNNLFTEAPFWDDTVMQDVVQSMAKLPSYFVSCIGDPARDPVWAYGPTLVMLAGLSIRWAQAFLREVDPTEPELAYYANCPEEDFRADVLKAHVSSGYPAGIYRTDWRMLRRALELKIDGFIDTSGGYLYLPWVRAAMMCHILRHTKAHRTLDGDLYLVAAYRGRIHRAKVDPEYRDCGMTSVAGLRAVASALAGVLQIPFAGGAKPTQLEQIGVQVFGDLRPSLFKLARPVADSPFMLCAPRVEMCERLVQDTEVAWINPGVQVSPVALLDPQTGAVNTKGRVENAEALQYNWDLGELSAEDYNNWLGTLPSKVEPLRPSQFIRRVVKNRNTLGHDAGADAVFDTVLLADFARPLLAGTQVGLALQKEFPPVFILPMGCTKEETTNQGKTNLGRIYLGALVPGILETGSNTSTSPPAQRSMAEPIHRDGTALYDEFLMPSAPDHFLNAAGIQTLATGGRKGPGRAGENALSPRLKHSLVFAAKLAAVPEDIHNRMVCIFMDALTGETRSTDNELNKLMTGQASLELRLSTILWLTRSGLLQTLATASLAPGDRWRMNGHATIAYQLATPEEIGAYLEASKAHCKAQLIAADASGLTGDLGIRQTFDPAYFWRFAKPGVKQNLYVRSQAGRPPSTLDIAKALIENDGDRKFNAIAAQFDLQEPAILQKFVSAFIRHPEDFDDGDLSLVYHRSSESKIRDGRGHPVAYCEVIKRPAPPPPSK